MESRRLDRALQHIDEEIDRGAITVPLQAGTEPLSFTLETLPSIRTFVGREEELNYYLSLLEHGNMVIIEGMAGNGKTWLGTRLAMTQSNKAVFWMTIRKGVNDNVDAIIFELAQFLAQQGDDVLWKTLQVEIQTGEGYPLRMKTFFHAYPLNMKSSLVAHSLEKGNYILCFDDFHLVNENGDILSFFRDLQSRLHATQFVIVMTRHTPLFVETMDYKLLKGLNLEDTRVLLHNAGISLPDDLFNELYNWTEGNAKLLDLFIAWVKNEKRSPQRIRTFIETMVHQRDIKYYLLMQIYDILSTDERKLLNAISIFRVPVPHTVLQDVLSDELKDLPYSISRLVRKHILEESDDGETIFFHALVREFFYEMLVKSERTRIHKVAAKSYEDFGNYLEAGFHYHEACEPDEAMRVLTDHIDDLVNAGYSSAVLKQLDQLKQIHLDKERRALVHHTIADLLIVLGIYDQAVSNYMLALTDSNGKRERADIFRKIAQCYQKKADYVQSLHHLDLGAAEVREMVDAPETALISIAKGFVLCHIGQPDKGIRLCEAALQKLQDPAYRKELASGYADLGWIHIIRGTFDQAVEVLDKAVQIQEEIHDLHGLATTLSRLGRLYWQKGQWPEALRYHEKSMNIAVLIGDLQLEALSYRHIALINWNKGEYQKALAGHKKALTLYERIGDLWGLASSLKNIGAVYYNLGEFDQGLEFLERSSQLCEQIGADDFQAYIYLYSGKTYVRTGRLEEGIALLDKARLQLKKWNYSNFYIGMAYRALGEAYILKKEWEKAVENLSTSLRMYEVLKNVYQLAKTKYWFAVMYQARGEKQEASEYLAEVITVFEQMSARDDLQKACELLSALPETE